MVAGKGLDAGVFGVFFLLQRRDAADRLVLDGDDGELEMNRASTVQAKPWLDRITSASHWQCLCTLLPKAA